MEDFLDEHFEVTMGLSANTFALYSGTLLLLTDYLYGVVETDHFSFPVEKLDKDLVQAFLRWYKEKNEVSVRTVMTRLSVIRLFAKFIGKNRTDLLRQMNDIVQLRVKVDSKPDIRYLSVKHTSLLLGLPKSGTVAGMRHKVALTVLYDTGCRVQELCDLTMSSITIDGSIAKIRIYGKGNKTRTVTVSEETTSLIKAYINEYRSEANPEDPFIVNQSHNKMQRVGMTHILKKYGDMAHTIDPEFPASIHCHMLRHSKAMHMLGAGLSLDLIRDRLGHTNIATTNVYISNCIDSQHDAQNKLEQSIANAISDIEDSPKYEDDRQTIDVLKALNKNYKSIFAGGTYDKGVSNQVKERSRKRVKTSDSD